jgi:hypothetical protein
MCDLGYSTITTDRYSAPKYSVPELASVWNNLMPLSTYSDKKQYQGERYDFPNLYLTQHIPLWKRQDPIDTRAELQNELLRIRHFDK